MVQHVHADLVRELERPHREAGAETHRGVDRLDRDALRFMDPRGLFEVRSEDASRDESGHVLLHDNDGFPEGGREVDGHLEGRVARRFRSDDLHELHEHRRVEEMHAHDFLRALRRAGHPCDRQRGRVRREDRLLRGRLIQLEEDFLLQFKVLEDRLDRDVRLATRFPHIERPVNARERFVRLFPLELVLSHELVEGPADPVHPAVDVLHLDVPHPDFVAVEGRELRDAVAHLPCPDDRDFHGPPLRGMDSASGA